MSSPTNRRESGKHKERGGKDRKRRHHHHNSSSKGSKGRRASAATAASSEKGTAPSPSPYHLVTVSLYLTISPRHSYWSASNPERSPIAGVRRDHLDPMLMSHFEPVDGVVLGYNNVRFESDTARIVAECPFARAWVTVDLLVWRPRRGMLLQGWVNLSSASHVGLLVENTWNVAVRREKIPADWTWTEEEEEGEDGRTDEMEVDGGDDAGDAPPSEGHWVDGNGEKVAGLREFKVDGIKAMGHMVSMEGSLLGVGKAKRVKKGKT